MGNSSTTLLFGGLAAAGVALYMISTAHSAAASPAESAAPATPEKTPGLSQPEKPSGSSSGTKNDKMPPHPSGWTEARISTAQGEINSYLSEDKMVLLDIDGAIGKHTCGGARYVLANFGDADLSNDLLALAEYCVGKKSEPPVPAPATGSKPKSAKHANNLLTAAMAWLHSWYPDGTQAELCT